VTGQQTAKARKRARKSRLKSCLCHGCDRAFDCAGAAVVLHPPCCEAAAVLVCAKCAWFALTHFDSASDTSVLATGVVQ